MDSFNLERVYALLKQIEERQIKQNGILTIHQKILDFLCKGLDVNSKV